MLDSALTLAAPAISLHLDAATVRTIVAEVVRETLAEIGADRRLAYSESEAAELLGLKRHQLRDCRLRGEIRAAKCGKEVRYQRGDLIRFLDAQSREGR